MEEEKPESTGQSTTDSAKEVEGVKARPSAVLGIVVAAVILVGAGILISRGKKADMAGVQTENGQPSVSDLTTPAVEGTTDVSQEDTGVNVVSIEGGMYYFRPDVIRAKKGEKIKVTLTSAGGNHNFVIDEFDAKTQRVGTGESTSVEFTPDKTGTFEFYCSVANHRQMGMKGVLVVEE